MDRPILARTGEEATVTVLGEYGPWRLVRTGAGQKDWTHSAMLRVRNPADFPAILTGH